MIIEILSAQDYGEGRNGYSWKAEVSIDGHRFSVRDYGDGGGPIYVGLPAALKNAADKWLATLPPLTIDLAGEPCTFEWHLDIYLPELVDEWHKGNKPALLRKFDKPNSDTHVDELVFVKKGQVLGEFSYKDTAPFVTGGGKHVLLPLPAS